MRLPRPAPLLLTAVAGLLVLLSAPKADAVPSFARQTGFSCAQCHTAFPELTPFGRTFKATGYTMTMTKTVTDHDGDRSTLALLGLPPLAVMLQASVSHTATALQPDAGKPAAKNNDVLIPQQLSLFYAGALAPKVGGFIQLTYDGVEDKLSIDNVDLRFAHTTMLADKELVFGFTVNNNPTVSDLWNSTPAWGVPFASSATAPGPTAAPLIASLGQTVAGLGAYGLWNGLLYLEFAAYKSAPLGGARPLDAATGATNVIDGAAPYWRAALQHDVDQHHLMVGTFGMSTALFPGGATALVGKTDRYTDTAIDAQYQYIGEEHIVTAVASLIHESQTLSASLDSGTVSKAEHALNAATVSAAYLYKRLLGGRLTFMNVNGSTNADVFAPGPITGSANGGALSTSMSADLTATPWLNTQFVLRYTAYLRFNGGTTNYDGAGRNASDNNTLYALAWLAF